MLVFSAIAPHSPLLIPEIGKDNYAKLELTAKSLKALEGRLYAAQPETIIIISPHGPVNDQTFLLNFSPKFKGDFSEFGYFSAKPSYYGDNELSYKIKTRLKTRFNMHLTTMENLDYGVLVPLHYLLAHNKTVKIIPVSPASALSLNEHCEFGKGIAEEIAETEKRIAVISSIETSNKLSKISPAGYKPGAKKFDEKIIKITEEKNTKELLSLKAEDIEKYGLDEIKALALFLGIMYEKNCKMHTLSYESPFGIGHLAMECEM